MNQKMAQSAQPNVAVQWATILLCNWEVKVSNLGPEIGHSDQ
jgi:hypothetical protein